MYNPGVDMLFPMLTSRKDALGEGLPEVGSKWIHRITGEVIQVADVRFATLTGSAGRQLCLECQSLTSDHVRDIWLEDFLRAYLKCGHGPAN